MKTVAKIFQGFVISISVLFICVIMFELTRHSARFFFKDANSGAIVGFIGGILLCILLWRILRKK